MSSFFGKAGRKFGLIVSLALLPALSLQAAASPALFPAAIATKYAGRKAGEARMHTCLDQYHANKASNGNGGLKWIQKGGGYYSACLKKLKATPADGSPKR